MIIKVIKQQWDYNLLYTHMIYDDAYNYIASGDLIEQLDSLMFEKIYVDPLYRGQGYGKKIVELLLEQCLKSKINNVYLKVHYDNIQAQNLYKKYGFIIDSIDNQYVWMNLKTNFKTKI